MVATFVNETGFMGVVLYGLTNNVTGSLFLTLLAILLLLLVVALALHIPIEGVAIIYLPLLLTMLAWTQDSLAIAGCALILLGIVLAKNLVPR